MFSKTDIIRTHLFCILLLSTREQQTSTCWCKHSEWCLL